jgi:hypothetical protein
MHGTNAYVGAIEGFKSQIKSIQRASLFDVAIPDFKYGEGDPYMLKFGVKNAPFPGSTVGDLAVNYMGRAIHWYGDRQYGGTWATTCILDGEWKIFNALYAWNQGMGGANRIVSEDLNMHEHFKVDAYVTAYSSDGRAAHRVKLIGLWPQDIGEISMDWCTADTAVDLTVTWVYDYVVTDRETALPVDLGEGDQTGNVQGLEGTSGGSPIVGGAMLSRSSGV